MKKIAAALVAAVLVLAPGATAKERPGAKALLVLKDGRSARGELYGVKSREIEIVNALGDHEAYDVATIRRVELRTSIRKPVRTGALLGFGTGAVIGVKAVAGDDHGTVGFIGYTGFAALLGLVFALLFFLSSEGTRLALRFLQK